ncbi:MAG: DUF429 domain-containing protein [Verrucomicrobia bacterium]|jgi:uncharacterized protein|nr:DUF429 domain-containing protein [Verrucomicrobiota bacterium]
MSELKDRIYGVRVVGIDLSGPANTKETALVWGTPQGAALHYSGHKLQATDLEILSVVQQQRALGPVVVGLDAPLSYEPGGGMRAGDSALQKKLIAVGMHPGSVMAPTMTKMCYLTLRGISVVRMLAGVKGKNPIKIVEVHPGGAMSLGGAPVHDVKGMKSDPGARSRLRIWLESQEMRRLPLDVSLNDHVLAAAACALATWRWKDGRSNWLHAAELPHHPFDFAC